MPLHNVLRRWRRNNNRDVDASEDQEDDSSLTKKNPNVDDDTCVTDEYTDADCFTNDDRIEENNASAMLDDVMTDNLDLMLEIVMQIREDEDYAKTIFADCPRLQHMLDQHPDLRPIFEDPHLVRINFEQVYRNAGGVLPEDKPSRYKKILTCIVQHPLFKVFKFLLIIKKLYNFVAGGGFTMIRSCFIGIFGMESAKDAAGSLINNVGLDDMASSAADKDVLESAAKQMEDPVVQEQMKGFLNVDPDTLDEAIQNDPGLKNLAESNQLCGELMNDPDTMRILVEPDNLRALGDCPDMIAEDFADPNWTPPDVESVPFDDEFFEATVDGDVIDADVDNMDADIDMDNDLDGDGDVDQDDEGFMNKYERGEEAKSGSAPKKKQQRQNRKKNEGRQGGGFMSTFGTGLVDYIAAETVGVFTDNVLGGDDLFGEDMMEDQIDEVTNQAEESANRAENVAASTTMVSELLHCDDFADNVQESIDNVEEAGDYIDEGENKETLMSNGVLATENAALVGVVGVTAAASPEKEKEKEIEETDEPQKGRLRRFGGAMRGAIGALSHAVKETAASVLLGDDLGEEIAEMTRKDQDEDQAKDKETSTKDQGVEAKK